MTLPQFPNMTAEQVDQLAQAGKYWWLRAGTYIATNDREPAQPDDVYILETSDAWLNSFGSSQEVADMINSTIAANVATQSDTDSHE